MTGEGVAEVNNNSSDEALCDRVNCGVKYGQKPCWCANTSGPFRLAEKTESAAIYGDQE